MLIATVRIEQHAVATPAPSGCKFLKKSYQVSTYIVMESFMSTQVVQCNRGISLGPDTTLLAKNSKRSNNLRCISCGVFEGEILLIPCVPSAAVDHSCCMKGSTTPLRIISGCDHRFLRCLPSSATPILHLHRSSGLGTGGNIALLPMKCVSNIHTFGCVIKFNKAEAHNRLVCIVSERKRAIMMRPPAPPPRSISSSLPSRHERLQIARAQS